MVNINQHIEKRVTQVNALTSKATQQVALNEAKKLAAELGVNLENSDWYDYDFAWTGVELTVRIPDNTVSYDVLMNDKDTVISDPKWINNTKRKEFNLVTHNNRLTVQVITKLKLPEEDLGVLQMLGKVKFHSSSSTGYETVVCGV